MDDSDYSWIENGHVTHLVKREEKGNLLIDHRLGQLLLGVDLVYYSLRIIQYTLRTVDRYNLP